MNFGLSCLFHDVALLSNDQFNILLLLCVVVFLARADLVLLERSRVNSVGTSITLHIDLEGSFGFRAGCLLPFLSRFDFGEADGRSGPLLLARLPILIVPGKVTVLAETLRVVELLRVRACPRLFGPAPAMVAGDAHILRVVLFGLVRTVDDFSFLLILLKLDLFGIADSVSLVRALTRLWVRMRWGFRFGIAVRSLR